jgi:hypothetical protein
MRREEVRIVAQTCGKERRSIGEIRSIGMSELTL